MAKLYILVEDKLSIGQKISQACHAAAEWTLKDPLSWKNEEIVILNAPRYLIYEAIRLGAVKFLDSYYNHAKACAFISLPEISEELQTLELVR